MLIVNELGYEVRLEVALKTVMKVDTEFNVAAEL